MHQLKGFITIMKTTALRRILTAVLCLALLAGALGLTACSDKSPALLELDGNTITANQYQFLLSRVKGSLYYAGYNVESADFWNMIINDQNHTYDDYFRNAVLEDGRRYLAALSIFEERGLVLPQSYLDRIDTELESYLNDAGSKSALNTQLATYGINVDMLREIYMIEAKYEYLQEVIYGKDGSLLAAEARMSYLNEHAVAFKQVLIRAFDYVYETDLNGDEVYYLPNENNDKVNNIAYDKENGNVRLNDDDNDYEFKPGETETTLKLYEIPEDAAPGEYTLVCSFMNTTFEMKGGFILEEEVTTHDSLEPAPEWALEWRKITVDPFYEPTVRLISLGGGVSRPELRHYLQTDINYMGDTTDSTFVPENTTATITINGESLTGSYEYRAVYANYNDSRLVYSIPGQDGVAIYFSLAEDTGKLVQYEDYEFDKRIYNAILEGEVKVLSEEECVARAKALVGELFGDVESYVLHSVDQFYNEEPYGTYSIQFRRYVDQTITDEYITICIGQTGAIREIESRMVGGMEGVRVPAYDEAEILKAIERKLLPSGQKTSICYYAIKDFGLTRLRDGALYLRYTICVRDETQPAYERPGYYDFIGLLVRIG